MFSKVEVITCVARRRRFTTEQKLLVVNETLQPGMSISYVARRHGLSASLVFRWRRLMSEGGKEAVRVDEDVVAASEVRRLVQRVRELERLLGHKTMEVEILKEALDFCPSKETALFVAVAAAAGLRPHHVNKPRVRSSGVNSNRKYSTRSRQRHPYRKRGPMAPATP
jgi:transposase